MFISKAESAAWLNRERLSHLIKKSVFNLASGGAGVLHFQLPPKPQSLRRPDLPTPLQGLHLVARCRRPRYCWYSLAYHELSSQPLEGLDVEELGADVRKVVLGRHPLELDDAVVSQRLDPRLPGVDVPHLGAPRLSLAEGHGR